MEIKCNLRQGENGAIYLLTEDMKVIKILSKNFATENFNLYDIEEFNKDAFIQFYKKSEQDKQEFAQKILKQVY